MERHLVLRYFDLARERPMMRKRAGVHKYRHMQTRTCTHTHTKKKLKTHTHTHTKNNARTHLLQICSAKPIDVLASKVEEEEENTP